MADGRSSSESFWIDFGIAQLQVSRRSMNGDFSPWFVELKGESVAGRDTGSAPSCRFDGGFGESIVRESAIAWALPIVSAAAGRSMDRIVQLRFEIAGCACLSPDEVGDA